MKVTQGLYPIGELSTNELSSGRSGTESTCSMKCPNCMQVLVQTISERGTMRWTVDVPGVQIECRCCGYGWFVEKYRVTLRRYK